MPRERVHLRDGATVRRPTVSEPSRAGRKRASRRFSYHHFEAVRVEGWDGHAVAGAPRQQDRAGLRHVAG